MLPTGIYAFLALLGTPLAAAEPEVKEFLILIDQLQAQNS